MPTPREPRSARFDDELKQRIAREAERRGQQVGVRVSWSACMVALARERLDGIEGRLPPVPERPVWPAGRGEGDDGCD